MIVLVVVKVMTATKTAISDTVTFTADGRTVVDVGRLLGKQHMREAIRQMRSKTRIVQSRAGKFISTDRTRKAQSK